MRIKRTDMVAGQPIKLVRDLVRGLGGRRVNIEWIAKRFLGNDVEKARMIVEEMVTRGWLERDGDYYECGETGGRLANARLLSPITRARADKIVADLIERTRAVNANSELLCWVNRLHVFGSYNSTSDDLGDVDVAYELERRPTAQEEWTDVSLRRAFASGKQINNFIDQLLYGQNEVKLLLKNRERYLSLHDVDDLRKMKTESKLIYERQNLE